MILKKKKQTHIQRCEQRIIRTFKSKYRRPCLSLPIRPIVIGILSISLSSHLFFVSLVMQLTILHTYVCSKLRIILKEIVNQWHIE